MKSIRPALGFTRVSHDDFLYRAVAVSKKMTGNPDFPFPPVDMAVFAAGVDNYKMAISDALDKGIKALSVRNQQREVIEKWMRLLGAYVQFISGNDMVIFLSSGFEPISDAPLTPKPLPQPSVMKIRHAENSGKLLVSITPLRNARHYELRYSPQIGGIPGEWVTMTISRARPATLIDMLTPGTIYAFQVRGYGVMGYTDWSDSATCMCT